MMLLLFACTEPKDTGTTDTVDTGATETDTDTDTDSETDTDTDVDTDTDTDHTGGPEVYYGTVTVKNGSPWIATEVYIFDYYGGRQYEMLDGNPMAPSDERSWNVEADAYWQVWAIRDDTSCASSERFAVAKDEDFFYEFTDFDYTWDGVDCY